MIVLLHAEECSEHPRLSAPIVLRHPEDLAFSDHLCCFDALIQHAGRRDGACTLHGSPAALHVPVIRFDAVVPIARPSIAAFGDKLTFVAQGANGCSIAAVSVDREHSGRPVIGIAEQCWTAGLIPSP